MTAAGESDATLRLEPGQLEARAECGELLGSWRANRYGMFVALVHGSDSGCVAGPTPGWLDGSTGFRYEGGSPVLLDRDGEVIARLSGAGDLPEIDDEVREQYAPPAPLPDGLPPVDDAQLLDRRWYPADPPGAAYLEFAGHGSWSGLDGCNHQGGRWVSGPDGALLAVSGVNTLMACDGQVPVGSWLTAAARAGLDGDELVLLDTGGEEVGRLRSVG